MASSVPPSRHAHCVGLLLVIVGRRKRHVGTLLFAPASHPEPARKREKRIHMKDTHSDMGNSGKLVHSDEERPTSRGSIAPSGKTKKNTLAISNRAVQLIKKIARDAVKRGKTCIGTFSDRVCSRRLKKTVCARSEKNTTRCTDCASLTPCTDSRDSAER